MANLSCCDSDVLSEESQDAGIQNTNSSAPQDLLVISLVEQMTNHVADLDKANQENKMENESLNAELERYKERNSNLNSDKPSTSSTPIKIEVPSELPKVSLVNSSLKKIKYHLAIFDTMMKVRTTLDAIMEEAAVEQCSVDQKSFEIQQKQFIIENDRLLEQIRSQDIVHFVLNSSVVIYDSMKKNDESIDICHKCLKLEDDIDTVIRKLKETINYLRDNANPAKVKKDIDVIETINIELEHNLKAQIQDKVFANAALKNELRKLKGKNVIDTTVSKPNATTIAPGMFKLDIEPISHRLKNNRNAYKDYLKKTIENTDTIHGLVERARK
ncbi:hypothetical protein Tco_1328799 [Tanacetum coccineum]